MRLRRRLVLVSLGFAAALLAGALIPFAIVTTRSHLSGYIEQRSRETQSVVASLTGQSKEVQERILRDRYPVLGLTAGWLLDPDGSPLSAPTNPQRFTQPPTEEIEHARSGPDAHRIGNSPSGERLFLAVPVIESGRLSKILWISSSLSPVRNLDARTRASLAGIGAAALLAASLAGLRLAQLLAARLETVAAGAQAFAEGSLDQRIESEGRDEIAELAGHLNEMAARVQASVARERAFVDAAAHQLRTPLTAISIRLDRLRKIVPEAEPTEEVDAIALETRRLARLAEQLLDLSAAATPAAEPEAAAPAVALTLERVEPLAQQRGVRLRSTGSLGDASASGPAGALAEVLLNIVDNAVKFSPAGRDVVVDATATADTITIVVTDHGPGLPAGDREHLFEPFVRGRSDVAGHGLGLAICARLCAAAGATLTLEDAESGGTRAVLRWPAA